MKCIRMALVLLLVPLAGASEPPESAKQILTQADKLFQEKNWEKARALYHRALSAEADWSSLHAMNALQGAVECALKLDDWDEAWARSHHFRCYKSKHAAERPQWSYWDGEKERIQSEIKKLEGIRALLPKLRAHLNANPAEATTERRHKLSDEQIATDFAIIETLVGTNTRGSYRDSIEPEVWWNTKDQEEWNVEQSADRWPSWWNRDRGVPLGSDGKPQFVASPPTYASGLGTGEKVLFLLDEIERLDTTAKKNFAARALLWRALIAERLYGPLTDGRWRKERYDYDWSARPYFRKLLPSELSKPFWDLADDEVRTTVDGRAQIIKLPEKENPLALLRLIERKFAESDVIPEALYARGEYYQSRQQYDQALNAYGELLKSYPKHGSAKDAAKQIENIFKPGVSCGVRRPGLPERNRPCLSFAAEQTKFNSLPRELTSRLITVEKSTPPPQARRPFSTPTAWRQTLPGCTREKKTSTSI